MSRSALWRQEGAKKMREKEAEDLFSMAVEEGRNNPSKTLPLWGPDDSFHFNPVLLEKSVKSRYFQKCVKELTDWNKLVDEVYYNVTDLEPLTVGGQPSNAFCLLLRLLTLRCSEKQMKLLLDHPDSPYIRGIGFLYLRYAVQPETIWGWIESYLYDEESITVSATSAKTGGSRQQKSKGGATTIGGYVRRLFSSDRDYYGTMLPRLPIKVERELQVKLLFAETIKNRAEKHRSNFKTMDHFQTVGTRVMALYGDEDNPVTWYEGVVDRVLLRDGDQVLKDPKFVVTFPEYGNTETVTLGEMEKMGVPLDSNSKNRSNNNSNKNKATTATHARDERRGGRSNRTNSGGYNDTNRGYDRGYDRGGRRDSERRGYSNDRRGGRDDYRGQTNADSRRGYRDRNDFRDRRDNRSQSGMNNDDDLYEEVRRRERESVTARGKKDVVSRRPTQSTGARDNRRGYAGDGVSGRDTTTSNTNYRTTDERNQSRSAIPSNSESSSAAPIAPKRSAKELAEQQEKRRKLIAKYG